MKHLIFVVLALLMQCDNDNGIVCTEQFVYGLNVIVKDANTSDIIIDGLTVIVTDGDYQEELMIFPESTNYVGAGERPGQYILEITSANYQTYTSSVIEVGSDECHVIPEVVDVFLQPN